MIPKVLPCCSTKQSAHTHVRGNIAQNPNDSKGLCMKSVAAPFASRSEIKWQSFWLGGSNGKWEAISLPSLSQPSSSNSSRSLTMLTKNFLWALNHWWSLYHNNILLSPQCSPVLRYSNIPLCLFYHLHIQIQLGWWKYGNAFLEIAFSVTCNTQRRAPCCESLMTATPVSPKELTPPVKALSLLPGQHLTSPSYLGNGHEWPREKNLSEGKGLHPAEQKKSPEESRRKHTTPSKGTQLEVLLNGTPHTSCPTQHTFLEARQQCRHFPLQPRAPATGWSYICKPQIPTYGSRQAQVGSLQKSQYARPFLQPKLQEVQVGTPGTKLFPSSSRR